MPCPCLDACLALCPPLSSLCALLPLCAPLSLLPWLRLALVTVSFAYLVPNPTQCSAGLQEQEGGEAVEAKGPSEQERFVCVCCLGM